MIRRNNEIFTLGFSLGHDTGAAIISSIDGIIVAVNEERMSRIKQTKSFPIRAIKECFRLSNLTIADIKCIAYTNYEEDTVNQLVRREAVLHDSLLADICNEFTSHEDKVETFIRRALSIVDDFYIYSGEIVRVDHHTAHIMSVLPFMSESSYILSMDGFGDGLSSMLVRRNKDSFKFEVLQTQSLKQSIGLVYQFTTGALGFTMNLHEGKITGMAARGHAFDALHIYQEFEDFMKQLDNEDFRKMYCYKNNIKYNNDFPIIGFTYYQCMKLFLFAAINSYVNAQKDKQQAMYDVCAAVQRWTEAAVINFIDDDLKPYLAVDSDKYEIGLVGGLFANVELNRRIVNTHYFSKVFIFPNMGDGGLAVGCAFHALFDCEKKSKYELKHVFFGYNANEDSLANIIGDDSIALYNVRICDDKPEILARLIAEGFIVANVEGAMEYGPRALCHRSIHFNCDHPDVSQWLNTQLQRTETMPFAPVLTHDNAVIAFKDYTRVNMHAAEYMTVNFLASQLFRRNCPGAVHIDGTVRAQVVHESNTLTSTVYNALIAYEKLTNRIAFINTSFNKHGEPIVRTAKEALERFEDSNIHFLFINDLLFTNPKISKLPRFSWRDV